MNVQYNVIAETIDYLVANYKEQPDLQRLATHAGYESTHFQKLFKRYVGISPKNLVQYMNMRYARDLLHNGLNSLDAATHTGLSSTSRLHDLCVSTEAFSPGEIKKRGENVTITYGFQPTMLGEIIIAKTARGICWLGFLVDEKRYLAISLMKERYMKANFVHDNDAIVQEVRNINAIWHKEPYEKIQSLTLDLHGTNFQIQVWKALLSIDFGQFSSYGEIANLIGKPKAARAVGSAVGKNPVSLLIPCHRVIQSSGIVDNYLWGSARKKLILALEQQYL